MAFGTCVLTFLPVQLVRHLQVGCWVKGWRRHGLLSPSGLKLWLSTVSADTRRGFTRIWPESCSSWSLITSLLPSRTENRSDLFSRQLLGFSWKLSVGSIVIKRHCCVFVFQQIPLRVLEELHCVAGPGQGRDSQVRLPAAPSRRGPRAEGGRRTEGQASAWSLAEQVECDQPGGPEEETLASDCSLQQAQGNSGGTGLSGGGGLPFPNALRLPAALSAPCLATSRPPKQTSANPSTGGTTVGTHHRSVCVWSRGFCRPS